MIYAPQLRAGRVLLGWRQEDLARAAGVGLATVQRIERSNGPATGHAGTIWRLQAALEAQGVHFTATAKLIAVSLKLPETTPPP